MSSRIWVGGSSPNSDFFFVKMLCFFVLFFVVVNVSKKNDMGVGRVWPIRIFPGFFLTWQNPSIHMLKTISADTRHWPNVVLMLGRRRRRRASIGTTLGQRLVIARIQYFNSILRNSMTLTSFVFTELANTMKYGGGVLYNLVFTEWRHCVSQNEVWGRGCYITLFSPGEVTAFHRMKYGEGVLYTLVFTEWYLCVSQYEVWGGGVI